MWTISFTEAARWRTWTGFARPALRLPRLWALDPGSGEFAIYWAEAAEFGELHPRPSPEQLKMLYGLYFGDRGTKGPRRAGRLGRFLSKARLHLAWRFDRSVELKADRLDALLGGRRSRVCDVGCGTGELIASLRDLGQTSSGWSRTRRPGAPRRPGGSPCMRGRRRPFRTSFWAAPRSTSSS